MSFGDLKFSLDYHPKDKPRMTYELMTEIAQDYMKQMGLTYTPFIVVRHYDKEHPHCHIVFSRVDNDGKILTQTTNFKKNERVCKALNRKYQLMQGKSKLNTDVSKLRGKEKVRYQRGETICAHICKPDDIVGKHHWISGSRNYSVFTFFQRWSPK